MRLMCSAAVGRCSRSGPSSRDNPSQDRHTTGNGKVYRTPSCDLLGLTCVEGQRQRVLDIPPFNAAQHVDSLEPCRALQVCRCLGNTCSCIVTPISSLLSSTLCRLYFSRERSISISRQTGTVRPVPLGHDARSVPQAARHRDYCSD